MSEMTWKRNTAGLTAHAQSRKEQKRKGVEEVITAPLREQKPVNLNTVAKAAIVSKFEFVSLVLESQQYPSSRQAL
jgi:hypothetical protein